MPHKLEAKLKKEAAAKGLKGHHAAAYVYGTMRKAGWVPGVKWTPHPKSPMAKRKRRKKKKDKETLRY